MSIIKNYLYFVWFFLTEHLQQALEFNDLLFNFKLYRTSLISVRVCKLLNFVEWDILNAYTMGYLKVKKIWKVHINWISAVLWVELNMSKFTNPSLVLWGFIKTLVLWIFKYHISFKILIYHLVLNYPVIYWVFIIICMISWMFIIILIISWVFIITTMVSWMFIIIILMISWVFIIIIIIFWMFIIILIIYWVFFLDFWYAF